MFLPNVDILPPGVSIWSILWHFTREVCRPLLEKGVDAFQIVLASIQAVNHLRFEQVSIFHVGWTSVDQFSYDLGRHGRSLPGQSVCEFERPSQCGVGGRADLSEEWLEEFVVSWIGSPVVVR